MRRWLVPEVLLILLFFTSGVIACEETKKPPVLAKSKPKKMVALTIDDGPGIAFVRIACKILKEHEASATFFCIGRNVQGSPEALKMIHVNGFEVGNHSFSHHRFTSLSANQLKQEISKTTSLIEKITGKKPVYVRPPQGAYNRSNLKVIEGMGYRLAMWTIDPRDWRGKYGPDTDKTIHYILANLQSGSVIILHEKRNTWKALPILLDSLTKKGYQVVSLRELEESKKPHQAVAKKR